jgi:hypothetical protein
MSFIELSVLTQIQPKDGKGSSTTRYLPRVINTDYIIDIIDDPNTEDLLHINMCDGKLLAEGKLKNLKKILMK